MAWENVKPGFRDLVQQFGYSGVLMIHCAGNSIGNMSLRRLQKYMKLIVTNFHSMRPNSRIIWSQILPRTYYRHMF